MDGPRGELPPQPDDAVINDDYFEIGFPLEGTPPPKRPKGREGGK
jgi:hypothetical protein